MYQNKYPKMIIVSIGVYSINRPEAGYGWGCICIYIYKYLLGYFY